MQPKRFAIGFWNGNTVRIDDPEQIIREWADLKFTLAMTPTIPDTPEAHANARLLLDLAEENGIQVIFTDARIELPGSNFGDMEAKVELPDGYRERAAAAVRDFGNHPAVWGFFVVDEPVQGNLDSVGQACKIIRDLTDKEPYINLLPNHTMSPFDKRWTIQNMVGFEDFAEYLDHIVDTTGARMLCYDCYCQMSEEWGGRDQYFRNLAEYQASSIKHDIPFWTITLSEGHWMYRAPSPEELGWEFFSALAYGAQGVMYFLYRDGGCGSTGPFGYGAPIDQLGQQGPLCQQMRRQHDWFQRFWEDRFRKCKVQRTSHWPEAPYGTRAFDGSLFLKSIEQHSSVTRRADSPASALVGEFVDDQGRPHVMIVNNSPDPGKNVALVLTFDGKRLFAVGGEPDDTPVQHYSRGSDIACQVYIMPGQAVFYRLEQCSIDN